MKGLELAEAFWREAGRPALARACPEAAERWCVGLVGEGSECFGFDDEISRDHDWGPGFCVWLAAADYLAFGAELQRAYDALPHSWQGFERLRVTPETAGRVGVMEMGSFYEHYLGISRPPRTVGEWLSVEDEALATCTNGCVFEDENGSFSAFRNELLLFYPQDILLKKLAARCALAAQAGQYNYDRCLRRGDAVAALQALSHFIDHAQAAVFLLNKRYRPYYKWAQRMLRSLPLLGSEVAPILDEMVQGLPLAQQDAIERVCALLISVLREKGLSESDSGFLLDHAREVQGRVHNDALRGLPLMLHKR